MPGHHGPGARSSPRRTFCEMPVCSPSSQREPGFCHLQPTASSLNPGNTRTRELKGRGVRVCRASRSVLSAQKQMLPVLSSGLPTRLTAALAAVGAGSEKRRPRLAQPARTTTDAGEGRAHSAAQHGHTPGAARPDRPGARPPRFTAASSPGVQAGLRALTRWYR